MNPNRRQKMTTQKRRMTTKVNVEGVPDVGAV
jgi:hypothetical protein